MALNLADGQLAATSATILGASSAGAERTVTILLHNTSASTTETMILTLQRSGSTARRVVRAVLSSNEGIRVSNLPMDPSDVLAGSTTNATTVDYTISDGDGGAFEIQAMATGGATKTTADTSTVANLTATGTFTATADTIRSAGYSDFSHRNRVRVFHDFEADAGATLPVPFGKQDTSSAGTPTLDYVADALNGEYTLTHDATSEAQNLTLYWGDQLMIDPTKNPVLEVKLKINFAGANFSADQRIVIGLATARNATLDSTTQNVWFRIEGANLNILWETDDATTDDDDNDSTIDIVDNTYTTFRIDCSDLTDIKFFVDGVRAGGGTAAAVLTASMKLQPFIEIQRDAGTEAEAVSIDYVMVEWDR